MKFNEDMFAGKMSNLVDVCDYSHCVLDTRKMTFNDAMIKKESLPGSWRIIAE